MPQQPDGSWILDCDPADHYGSDEPSVCPTCGDRYAVRVRCTKHVP